MGVLEKEKEKKMNACICCGKTYPTEDLYHRYLAKNGYFYNGIMSSPDVLLLFPEIDRAWKRILDEIKKELNLNEIES